jgi:hypothetical protein
MNQQSVDCNFEFIYIDGYNDKPTDLEPKISLRKLIKHKETWRDYMLFGPRPFLRKSREYLEKVDGTTNFAFRTAEKRSVEPVRVDYYRVEFESKYALPRESTYPVVERIEPPTKKSVSKYWPADTIVNIQGQVTWGTVTTYLERPTNNPTSKDPPVQEFTVKYFPSFLPYYLEIEKNPKYNLGTKGKLLYTVEGFKPAHKWSPVHFIPQNGNEILKKRRYPLEFPTGLLELPREIIESIVYDYSDKHVLWNYDYLTTGEIPGDYYEHKAKRYRLSTTGYYPWLRGVHSEDLPTKSLFENSDEENTSTTTTLVYGLKTTGLSDEEEN